MYYCMGTKSTDNAAKSTVGKELDLLQNNLKERMKELACLYAFSSIVETPNLSIGELLQKLVIILPNAWQYSEITCARITINLGEYKTPNFKETSWKQSANVLIDKNIVGSIDIFYLKEQPSSDEGPFLLNERKLLNAIAERLGRVIERLGAENDLKVNEKDLKYAQEIAKVGSWKWNLTTREISWSDEMYQIFGIDKNTYKGRLGDAISSVIHPDDLHLVLPENASSFSGVKPVEYRIIWPDKSIRYISALAGVSTKDAKGEIISMSGTAQDITERKMIEQTLASNTANINKLNDFMMNRELKMVELKKEIQKLKEAKTS